MNYQLYFITIFLTLAQVIQLRSQQNPILFNENRNYISNGINDFAFESNEGNITRIDKIDFRVIQNSFIIEAFDSGQLIHLIFLHSILFKKEITFCVCQLLKTKTSYCITCIDGIFISSHSSRQLIYHQNFQKIQIHLKSQQNEYCQELFADNKNKVIVYCYTLETLKLYKINLKEQISILFEVEGNFSHCSQKFFNVHEQSYLAIYNCENWQIFEVSQSELNLVFKKQLIEIDLKLLEEINILNQIYICQNFLYFVENTNYYKFTTKDKQFIFLQKEHIGQSIIKGLVFDEFCNIFYSIFESEQKLNSQMQINFETKEIFLNKNQNFELYIMNQFLLLKQESALSLILCDFLNQTYKVNSSKLQFINQVIKYGSLELYFPQLFFSIDEHSSSAIFYEYFHLPTQIKPKKRFLFNIQSFNIFVRQNSSNIFISEVFYQNQMNLISSFDMFAINQCKPAQKEILYKHKNLFQQTENIVSFQQQKQIIENITNEQNIFELFPNLHNENIEKIILIDNSTHLRNHSLIFYLTSEQFYVYSDFKKSIIYSKNRNENQIFSYEGIAIINVQKFQIISLQIINEQAYEKYFNLNQSIETINQCLSYLIIKFSDQSYLIFDIVESRIIQIEKEIDKQILDFGVPIFYFGKQIIKLIQYHNCLIIKTKNNLRIYQIEDVQILRISRSNFWFLINTIQQQKDIFINYYFNGRQLIRDKEFNFEVTKFIRPLIFSESSNYISFAQIANQDASIITIDFGDDLQILHIKKTNNFHFTQLHKTLFYFDEKNHYKLLNQDEYIITLSDHLNQKNFVDNFKIMVKVKVFANSQDILAEKEMDLKIINQCYKLLSEKQSIKIGKQEKLNLFNLIAGPLSNLSLSDYNYYSILGPFKIQQQIKECQNDFLNSCKIDYAVISSISHYNYFDFQCIEFLEKSFCNSIQQEKIYEVRLIMWSIGHMSQISLYFFHDRSAYFLQMFTIDQQNKILKETHYIEIKEINFSQLDFFYNQKMENQIFAFTFSNKLIRKTYMIYANFDEGNYLFDELLSENFDICFINNFNKTYIIMQIFHEIEINLVSFSSIQKQLKSSFKLGQELLDFLWSKYLFEKIENSINSFLSVNIKFISCSLDDDYLEFDLFIVLKVFSTQVKVFYNIQTEEKEFRFGHNFRNPLEAVHLKFNYLDSSILVLDSDSHHYIYDIESTKSMYDYYGKFIQQGIKLFLIDNTTYLCNFNQNIKIIEFGYWIEQVGVYNQSQEKIYLIASNDVSQLQIEILPKMEEKSQAFTLFVIISLFISTILLLIIIYLKRRSKLMMGQKQLRI